jgi:hypothetical protein
MTTRKNKEPDELEEEEQMQAEPSVVAPSAL